MRCSGMCGLQVPTSSSSSLHLPRSPVRARPKPSNPNHRGSSRRSHPTSTRRDVAPEATNCWRSAWNATSHCGRRGRPRATACLPQREQPTWTDRVGRTPRRRSGPTPLTVATRCDADCSMRRRTSASHQSCRSSRHPSTTTATSRTDHAARRFLETWATATAEEIGAA